MKFDERKLILEKELEDLKQNLREASQKVSEIQISIIEKNGELKLVNKIINDLNKK